MGDKVVLLKKKKGVDYRYGFSNCIVSETHNTKLQVYRHLLK
jgi:hypothetical protein